MNKTDLLLHPVRTRILQELIINNGMTTMQLRKKLGNVPQATVYRHVKLLYEAGIIQIAKTNKVNGKAEHVYEVSLEEFGKLQGAAKIDSDEEHIRHFSTFLSMLLKHASSYMKKNPVSQYQKDGFRYWYALMYLTDQEFEELINSINSIIKEAMENKKTPERKLRGYSYIFIPESENEVGV